MSSFLEVVKFSSQTKQEQQMRPTTLSAVIPKIDCLETSGHVPMVPDCKFDNVKLYSYSPDTHKVSIRMDYKQFWLIVSFICNKSQLGEQKNMKFEACGRIEQNPKTSVDMPLIGDVTTEFFTVRVICSKLPSFWIQIKVPLKQLMEFVDKEQARSQR